MISCLPKLMRRVWGRKRDARRAPDLKKMERAFQSLTLVECCLIACSCAGHAPSWWWKDPIRASLYCKHQGPIPPSELGHRDPEAIVSTVALGRRDMERCYANLVAKNSAARSVAGVVVIRSSIQPDGNVAGACISDTTLNDDATARCLLAAFYRLDFGKAWGPMMVMVPIRFEGNGAFEQPTLGELERQMSEFPPERRSLPTN